MKRCDQKIEQQEKLILKKKRNDKMVVGRPIAPPTFMEVKV